jgi:RNA polymerase sigma factor (sigma-70 family)
MDKEEHTRWERVLIALNALRSQLGDEAYGDLRVILRDSFERKRIDKLLNNENGLTLELYVQRVCHYYSKESSMVRELKHDPASEKWQEMSVRLSDIVRHFLLKKCGLPAAEYRQLSEDYVHEAVIAILTSPYDYDVSFMAWVTQLTHNICCNKARSSQTLKEKAVTDALPIDDGTIDTYHSIISAESKLVQREAIAQVVAAVSELSEKDQALLLDRYLHNQTQTMCAESRSVNPSTVHRQEKRILSKLRQKLEPDRYRVNEDKWLFAKAV